MDNTRIEDLLKVFERYAQMQEAHLRSLKETAQPDFERLGFERAQLFAELQNQCTMMIQYRQRGAYPATLSPVCQERLTILRSCDDVLLQYLQEYRIKLEQRLTSLCQGRQVLTRYGRLDAPTHPRFVSKQS